MKIFVLSIFIIIIPISIFAKEDINEIENIKKDRVVLKYSKAKIVNKKTFSNKKILMATLTKENKSIYINMFIPVVVKLSLSNFKHGDKLLYSVKNGVSFNSVKYRNDNIYKYITIYIAPYSYIIPSVKIYILNSKNILTDSKTVKFTDAKVTKVIRLHKTSFSGLITNDFKITSLVAKFYDHNSNIVNINMQGSLANTKNFRLPYDNIKDIQIKNDYTDFPNVKFSFKAIIPNSIENIKFLYYDTNKKDYISIEKEIKTTKEVVATVSGINPNNKYQNITYILIFILLQLLALIFLIYIREYKIFIILLLLFIYYFSTTILANGKIHIVQKAPITILPFDNDTIFYVTKKNRKVQKLKKEGSFYKIVIDDKVGWVNEKYVL